MLRYITGPLLFLSIVAALPAQNPATGIPVPDLVLQSFNRSFPASELATWSSAGNICEATFLQQQKRINAQFDTCGNLCNYSKKIEFKELPELVRISFATERYAVYQIAEVYENYQPGGVPSQYFTIIGRTSVSAVPLRFLPSGYQTERFQPKCPCSQ